MQFANAKNQLMQVVDTLAKDLPRIPCRRDSEMRVNLEVDDIFNIVTVLDEQKLTDNLPKYVVDGPDQIPSSRLVEGDLLCLHNRLAKMEAILNSLSLNSPLVTQVREPSLPKSSSQPVQQVGLGLNPSVTVVNNST
jgi:hypothetical protein